MAPFYRGDAMARASGRTGTHAHARSGSPASGAPGLEAVGPGARNAISGSATGRVEMRLVNGLNAKTQSEPKSL